MCRRDLADGLKAFQPIVADRCLPKAQNAAGYGFLPHCLLDSLSSWRVIVIGRIRRLNCRVSYGAFFSLATPAEAGVIWRRPPARRYNSAGYQRTPPNHSGPSGNKKARIAGLFLSFLDNLGSSETGIWCQKRNPLLFIFGIDS